FYRHVEKVADLTELDNGWDLSRHFAIRHAQDRAVEKNILAAGQIGVEPGTHLDQRRQTSAQSNAAFAGGRYPGSKLQHGRLSRSVRTDNTERLAAPDLETHIVERPEISPPRHYRKNSPASRTRGLPGLRHPITLAEVVDADIDHRA